MKQLINKILEKIETGTRKAGVCFSDDYTTCMERCENPEVCSAYQRYTWEQETLKEIKQYKKLKQ